MPQITGQQGLSNRDKGIVAGTILIVILALVAIYFTWQSQQPHVVMKINSPPGSALKLQAMKAMKEGQASGNPSNPGSEKPSVR